MVQPRGRVEGVNWHSSFFGCSSIGIKIKIDTFESENELGNKLFLSLFNYIIEKTSVYVQSSKNGIC